MKRPLILAAALLAGACSLFTPANIKGALDATSLGCVFASELTDAKAVTDACTIDQALVPVVERLIAQRQAAKSVGVVWGGDAGR